LAEKVHCHDSLKNGTDEGSEAGSTEEFAKEHMRVGKDAVKNDGEMREELGYNIESAPYSAKHEFYTRIPILLYADRNSSLAHKILPRWWTTETGEIVVR